MLRFSKRLFIVNLFGALFYLSCLMQWMWSLLPFLPNIIDLLNSVQRSSDVTTRPIAHVASEPPSALLTIFGIIITLAVVAVVIYIIIKTPTAVGRTGHKITVNAAKYVVPVVSKHQELSPKKRRQLTTRVVTYIKVALSVLPVIVSIFAYFIDTRLSFDIILLVAAILGVGTLSAFGVQLLLIKWLRVTPENAW